jgi:DNA-binding MarR family transcriptional regulator
MSEANQQTNDPNRPNCWGDDASITELFHRVVTLMRRHHHHHEHGGDPYRGQGRVLSILKMQPDISQKDIGFILDMRNQSLSELLIKLERSGYITRTPSEKDRRVMDIHLTELGLAAAEQMEKSQQHGRQIFDCLSSEEQANLSEYLKRIIKQMSAGSDEPRETGSTDYDFDPFWGVGKYADCCKRIKHEIKAHRRAACEHWRGHNCHRHGHI